MTRLRLGLTDHERRELDARRRTRNCLLGIVAMLIVTFVIR